MKVGRIAGAGSGEFVARMRDDEPWSRVSALGVDAPTTAAVIERLPEIGAALRRGTAVGDVEADAELRCPVVEPSKILAIGLNYIDHVRETGATPPEQPVVFAKFPTSLSGPTDPIWLDPSLTEQLDYESELAVVVGRKARRLNRGNALDYVFGYAVANDVSARDAQKRDGQISRSKSFDTFCPIGPWITTADEIADPQSIGVRAFVNGESRQDSSTAQMIFSVSDILVYLSASMTLLPGDVILTGTPPGVGVGRKPPVFLGVGDVVSCELDKLGRIENRVVADPLLSL